MVINVLAIISFVLSVLCTLFLGTMIYGSMKKMKAVKTMFKR